MYVYNHTHPTSHLLINKQATALLYFIFSSTITALALPTKRSTDFVPLRSLGGVGAVLRNAAGSTQIYYQAADGSIWNYQTSAPFDEGGTTDFNAELIPSGEASLGTPIIAVTNNEFSEVSSLLFLKLSIPLFAFHLYLSNLYLKISFLHSGSSGSYLLCPDTNSLA